LLTVILLHLVFFLCCICNWQFSCWCRTLKWKIELNHHHFHTMLQGVCPWARVTSCPWVSLRGTLWKIRFKLMTYCVNSFFKMCAVARMIVLCSSSLVCLPGMSSKCCYRDKLPVATVIIGSTFAFTFHMYCASISSSFYFMTFCALSLISFLNLLLNVSFVSRSVMWGLLVSWLSWLVPTVFVFLCTYHLIILLSL
jgi:hypothetical protein